MFNNNLGVAIASGVGIAFLGYCVYFDRKRRSHPDFRKNLIESNISTTTKERRRQQMEKAQQDMTKYPNLNDDVAVQKFFMAEIGLGEQLLGAGDIENGVEHLANAVSVTAHKENLLNVLRTTLPDPIFRMLIETLPETSKKIYNSHKAKTQASATTTSASASSTLRFESDVANGQTNKIVELSEEQLAVDDFLD